MFKQFCKKIVKNYGKIGIFSHDEHIHFPTVSCNGCIKQKFFCEYCRLIISLEFSKYSGDGERSLWSVRSTAWPLAKLWLKTDPLEAPSSPVPRIF